MCITDKAKETSSCADLFRCGATSVYLERGVFALPLGWLSLSSACLDATTIPHASGAWSRIFHLMQVCCLPWCPGRSVLCVLRAWLLGVCVSLALLCALPPGLPVPLSPGAVGLCSALLPGVWACCACPVGWACTWAFSRIFFRVLFSGIFPGLIFAAVSGFLFFLDVIFIRFPVLRDEFFHVAKFQELVHGGLVDSVALAF